MSVTLIVVMVSWVCAYVPNYRIMQIKYVQFFVYQLFLSKAVFFFLKKEQKETGTKCHSSFGELQTVQSD